MLRSRDCETICVIYVVEIMPEGHRREEKYKDMEIQHFFHGENAALYYLSPYVDVYVVNDGKLLLVRRDVDSRVILEGGKTDAMNIILSALRNGVSRQELMDMVSSENRTKAEQWIDICLRNGMIE